MRDYYVNEMGEKCFSKVNEIGENCFNKNSKSTKAETNLWKKDNEEKKQESELMLSPKLYSHSMKDKENIVNICFARSFENKNI